MHFRNLVIHIFKHGQLQHFQIVANYWSVLNCGGKVILWSRTQSNSSLCLPETCYNFQRKCLGSFESKPAKFHKIYEFKDVKSIQLLLLACRYQLAFMSVALPMYGISFYSNEISTSVAFNAGIAVTALTFSAFSMRFLMKKKNHVTSLAVDKNHTSIKVNYINVFGYIKEILLPVKYQEFVQTPALEINDKTFGCLIDTSKSSNVCYKLPYKNSVLPDKQLFLKIFGPTVYQVFKDRSK